MHVKSKLTSKVLLANFFLRSSAAFALVAFAASHSASVKPSGTYPARRAVLDRATTVDEAAEQIATLPSEKRTAELESDQADLS